MSFFNEIKTKLGGKVSHSLLKSTLTYKLVSALLKRQAGAFSYDAFYKMAQFALQQTSAVYTGKRPAVWNSAFFPNELLYATGFIPFAPEVAAAVAAAMDMGGSMLDRCDAYWATRDTCSFHRCAMGLALEGMLPTPAAVVASSQPCDGAPKLMEHAAQLYKCPVLLLDVPRIQTPWAEEYVARQLEYIAYRLAAEVGTKPDKDRLAAALGNSNRARQFWVKVNELRRAVPSLIKGEEALSLVYLTFTAQGSAEMVDIYRSLYEELSTKVNKLSARCEEQLAGLEETSATGDLPLKGLPGVFEASAEKGIPSGKEKFLNQGAGEVRRGRERTRLLWMQLKPYFKNSLFPYLESELGATVVFEEMSHVYWEPLDLADPYRSLARKVLSYPGHGFIERRAGTIVDLARRFNADAVVHFSHWGCRQSCGGLIPLRDRLRQAGLPFLILDGDCVDSRQHGEGQLRTRLEVFLEMLEPTPGESDLSL